MRRSLQTVRGRSRRVLPGGAALFCLHRKLPFALLLAGSLLCAVPDAQALVKLSIWGPVTFPDADPDLVPVIGPVDVRVRVQAIDRGTPIPWVLTIQADGDLTSGPQTISATNVSWTATPSPPLQSGTLSTVIPVLLGSEARGPRPFFGQLSFYFQNSWSYVPGNYSTTATVTLSTP